MVYNSSTVICCICPQAALAKDVGPTWPKTADKDGMGNGGQLNGTKRSCSRKGGENRPRIIPKERGSHKWVVRWGWWGEGGVGTNIRAASDIVGERWGKTQQHSRVNAGSWARILLSLRHQANDIGSLARFFFFSATYSSMESKAFQPDVVESTV